MFLLSKQCILNTVELFKKKATQLCIKIGILTYCFLIRNYNPNVVKDKNLITKTQELTQNKGG